MEFKTVNNFPRIASLAMKSLKIPKEQSESYGKYVSLMTTDMFPLYFVDGCLSFCTFSFGHCVVGFSSK
jgi:hypothetical protein